jgi:hypothetical protein
MKILSVSKPIVMMVLVVVIVQLACNLGSAAPTSPAPSVAPPEVPQPAPQATEAAATSTGEHATPAEAEAMLKLAVQHYQTVGREQALADFNVKKPPFVDRDLYVVCIGSDHKVSANGGFPLLVGVSADSVQDANGQPLGQVIWDQANKEPEGSLAYNWVNPLTRQQESKVLYYQKLDADVCGVAADNP